MGLKFFHKLIWSPCQEQKKVRKLNSSRWYEVRSQFSAFFSENPFFLKNNARIQIFQKLAIHTLNQNAIFSPNFSPKIFLKSRNRSQTGLPDGIFQNQKFQFGYILEGLGTDEVDISFGHLEYIAAIWYIL
jgi:hypothetical protein